VQALPIFAGRSIYPWEVLTEVTVVEGGILLSGVIIISGLSFTLNINVMFLPGVVDPEVLSDHQGKWERTG
jgi:hypothetical protein